MSFKSLISAQSGLAAIMVLASSCGKPKSSSIPPSVNKLRTESPVPGTPGGRWQALADYMGFPTDAADQATLEANLGTVPTTATNSTAGNGATLKKAIEASVVAKALETQCGGIAGLKYLSPTKMFVSGQTTPINIPENGSLSDSGKVYLLSYKLRDASGQPETTVRAALVTVPDHKNGSKGVPLAMYAHDADSGLTYGELAKLAGALQSSYVFAAPTYPGEPLCSTTLDYTKRTCADTPAIPAQGSRSLYDGDVREFMGLQNCMLALAQIADPSDTTTGFAYEPKEGDSTTANPFHLFAGVPNPNAEQNWLMMGSTPAGIQALYMGAGRGGNVATLAAARNGILLTDYNSGDDTVSNVKKMAKAASMTYAPHFVSAMALAAPSLSALMGSDRLKLEYVVKGQITNTSFISIPTWASWKDDVLSGYTAGTATVEATALEIARRDIVYMGPYLAPSLLNWKQYFQGKYETATSAAAKTRGSLGIIHGTEDMLFPYTHSQVGFGVFQKINQTLSGARSQVQTALAGLIAAGALPGGTTLDAAFGNAQMTAALKQALMTKVDEATANLALSAAKLHGFDYQVYAFQPADTNYTKACSDTKKSVGGKCFNGSSTLTHHLDDAFLASHLVSPASVNLDPAQTTLANGVAEATAQALVAGGLFTEAIPARQAVLLATSLPTKTPTAFPSTDFVPNAYSPTTRAITPIQMVGAWHKLSAEASFK